MNAGVSSQNFKKFKLRTRFLYVGWLLLMLGVPRKGGLVACHHIFDLPRRWWRWQPDGLFAESSTWWWRRLTRFTPSHPGPILRFFKQHDHPKYWPRPVQLDFQCSNGNRIYWLIHYGEVSLRELRAELETKGPGFEVHRCLVLVMAAGVRKICRWCNFLPLKINISRGTLAEG